MRDFAALLQNELDSLRASDRLRQCLALTGASRQRPAGPEGPLLSFASNDYLGLASHPDLAAAAATAAAAEGFGAGAARLVSGSLPSHALVEADLAHLLGRPAALLFPSGYQANLGVLTALAGPDDLIASDAANHASLIDGCRLSRARVAIYAHADPAAAATALDVPGSFRRRFVVTESLFSMDGDAAPLQALDALAQRHDAIFVVDEAHALGTLGPSGRGLCADAAISPDVLIGTLGKAFGAAGGFVAGAASLRELLVNRARTFVFTTAPPPPVAAAARAGIALSLGAEGNRRRERLRSAARFLHERWGDRVPSRPGPILPVLLVSDAGALAAAGRLRAAGLFVPAIRPPTVPAGTARLRVTLSSEHTDAELERLADAILRILP